MNYHANPIEFVELSKLIRIQIFEDHKKFRTEGVVKTVEDRGSLKKCKQELRQQIATLSVLKTEDGKRLTKRFDMERRVQEFYTSLFT